MFNFLKDQLKSRFKAGALKPASATTLSIVAVIALTFAITAPTWATEQTHSVDHHRDNVSHSQPSQPEHAHSHSQANHAHADHAHAQDHHPPATRWYVPRRGYRPGLPQFYVLTLAAMAGLFGAAIVTGLLLPKRSSP